MKGHVTMRTRTILALVGVLGLAAAGCDYIVPPPSFGTPTLEVNTTTGWSGTVIGVSENGGAVHVDLAIENKTGDWSAMDVGYTKASVVDGSGKSTDCSKVFIGTSVFVADAGWYLPDGFTMKGYTTDATGTVQMLYAECAGVGKASAKKLHIDYRYITGAFNYYTPSTYYNTSMDLDLSKVKADVKFPVAETSAGVIQKADVTITGINNCTVKLADIKRTDTGFTFSWESSNPTDYPAYVHIGKPPVIGNDGILYGFYQSPHLALAPITPSKDKATWTTTATVPADGKGFYLLVPVETKQQKYFVDHVLDISDK
jgi:hypothetical protein